MVRFSGGEGTIRFLEGREQGVPGQESEHPQKTGHLFAPGPLESTRALRFQALGQRLHPLLLCCSGLFQSLPDPAVSSPSRSTPRPGQGFAARLPWGEFLPPRNPQMGQLCKGLWPLPQLPGPPVQVARARKLEPAHLIQS